MEALTMAEVCFRDAKGRQLVAAVKGDNLRDTIVDAMDVMEGLGWFLLGITAGAMASAEDAPEGG